MARARRHRSSRRRSSRNGGSSILLYILGALVAVGLLGAAVFYRNQTEQEMAIVFDSGRDSLAELLARCALKTA